MRAFHGTTSLFPFPEFDKSMTGSSLVSNSKFNGFFFTTSKENSQYYSEYFICEVEITGEIIEKSDQPSLIAKSDLSEIAIVKNVLDGSHYSDIIIVPFHKLGNVKIIKWENIAGEYLYSAWREFFNGPEDEDDEFPFVLDKDSVKETLEMIRLWDSIKDEEIFRKFWADL